MNNAEFRRHVARLLALLELATGSTMNFADAYIGLYADLSSLENEKPPNAIDHYEERREVIGESIRLLRVDCTAKEQHPDWYERELARLNAMYLFVSLRYQIVRGLITLPEYNGGK